MSDPLQCPLLSVRDLTVGLSRGEQRLSVVNGIDFDLRAGEVLTVIGESGSGKSVMLRSLLDILPATARVGGRILLNGTDLAGLGPEARAAMRGRDISMIFQEPSTALDPVYPVGQQIVEAIQEHEDVDTADAWRRAKDLLDLVAIPAPERRLRNYPHEMSGGMRQRVMIALALACRPALLLADEPTTALDATIQIQILLLLRRLQREMGMALIFVTHDIGVAAEISDQVAVMYGGRFVEAGTVEQILTAPRHPYTRALLDSTVHVGLRGRPLETIGGAPPDLSALPPGCAFAPRCASSLVECLEAVPVSRTVVAGHKVACHRQDTLAAD